MKPLKSLFQIGAVCAALIVVASSWQSERPKNPEKAAEVSHKTLTPVKLSVSSRPKAPSKQVVTCSYIGEYLCFDFVVPEGECNVTVTEWYSNAVQNYTIDSSELSADIYVGELYESTVTITTANGNTYTAELTADPD